MQKGKIKTLFGLIHPFYGFDRPKFVKKYSAKEADEMMKRWKDMIDRISYDNSSALVIYPSESAKEKELIKYALKRIPEDRIALVKAQTIEQAKESNKAKEKISKRIGKRTKLLLCGEMTESCVAHEGKQLKNEMKIPSENAMIMADLSVTWEGKRPVSELVPLTWNLKTLQSSYLSANEINKRAEEIMKKNTPKTPSRLKKLPSAEKAKILRRLEAEAAPLGIAQIRKQQNKIDKIRGFCTLPKDKWRRRRR